MWKYLFLIFPVITCLFSIESCKKQDISNKPESLKYIELFKDNSPFYQKISDNAAIDPNSGTMIQSLISEANKGFVVCVKEWTVPVYFADANTKRRDVKMTESWAPKKKLKDVPIPEFAEPDPESDGHLVVVDEEGGCVYDFWKLRYKRGDHWKAGWGNALPLNGNGIFQKGLSARGSGFELLQGVIWPQELENGAINHALIFSFDHTKSGGPVSPATESDGTESGNDAIPEGALVRLNPNIDLYSLGLNSYELIIAKALQDYGMYCADDGGGLSLYAVNPISCKSNPYQNIWGDQTYIDLSKIPANEFQVLTLPSQSSSEPEIVNNACNNFD